jgi:hypothetical protein
MPSSDEFKGKLTQRYWLLVSGEWPLAAGLWPQLGFRCSAAGGFGVRQIADNS